MADDRVQPVPWVLRVWIFWSANTCSLPSAITKMSLMVSPGKCPPLTSTAPAPVRSNWCAAARMSSGDSTLCPVRKRASSRLGVIRRHRGANSASITAAALSSINTLPAVATTTGSSTTWRTPYWRKLAATTRMLSALKTMPILMASQPTSLMTESICACKMSGAVGAMACTPVVFCAVMAVMAVMP